MVAAISIPEKLQTERAPIRVVDAAEREERAAELVHLPERDEDDLRWRWQSAHGDFGVCSTFGAQLTRAYGDRVSDEAVQAARVERWKLRRRIRDQRQKRAIIPDRSVFDLERELRGEYIYGHESHASTPVDPYEDDRVLLHVRRAKRIDARLERAGENAMCVLFAAYGPPHPGWPTTTGGWPMGPLPNPHLVDTDADGKKWPLASSSRETAKKKFGRELVEIVAAIVAHEIHTQGETLAARRIPATARGIVIARLGDGAFVRRLKIAASKHLSDAARAYAEAR